MKRILLSVLMTALFACHPQFLWAKGADGAAKPELKPIAVVSLASYEQLMADANFLGELSDSPAIQGDLEATLNQFTQGAGLKGLDRTRPWGLTLQSDGAAFPLTVFIPVTDLKQLLGSLSPIIGEAADEGEGVYSLKLKGQRIFITGQNGWAFLASSRESLADLPQDPARQLGSLPRTYEIGIRIHVQNIPEMYRTMAIDQIRAGMQDNLARKKDELEEEHALRKRVVENQVKKFTNAINETDQLTIGWALDKQAKSSALELQMTAIPGSKTSKQIARLQDVTSAFQGFLLPDAAATLNFSAKLDKEETNQVATVIDGLRANVLKQLDKQKSLADEHAKQAAKDAVGQLFDAYKSTVLAGIVDGGAAVLLGEGKFTFVAGGFVADPQALENALKKSANVLNQTVPEFAIKYDVAKHAGVRFHTMTVPVQKDQARQVFGDKLHITVGIGSKSAYVAAGANGIATLETVIDRSTAGRAKTVNPVQLNVSLERVLKFAAAVKQDPLISMMADEIAKSEGKDRLTLTGRADKDGLVYRLEAQEGVLKLLGQASKRAAGGIGARAAR